VRLQQAVREAVTICLALCKLTFDLLTLKVVSESRVRWPTSVPILVFLGLSVLDLGPMYATDRRQTWHDPACLAGSCHIIRQTRIIAYASALWGGGIIRLILLLIILLFTLTVQRPG